MSSDKPKFSTNRTPASQPGEYADAGAKAVRPRDAATLIIVRQSKDGQNKDGQSKDGQPKILMGKRAATHKFMPNKFVFPGGRLDVSDQRLRLPENVSLAEPVLQRLRRETAKSVTDKKLQGLALAAIRETFEETGLVIGRLAKDGEIPRTSHRDWRDYFKHGVIPPLDDIDFVARAITPTYRTRRFDTRFFMVHDDYIHTDPDNTKNASGELLDLHWLTFDETHHLDLPVITSEIINIIRTRLKQQRHQQKHAPAPFIRFVRGKSVMQQL